MKYLKIFAFISAAILLSSCGKEKSNNNNVDTTPAGQNDSTTAINPDDTAKYDRLYQFDVLDGNDEMVSLEQYRGMVVLVVNTATQCGYTPQYTSLEGMYQKYKNQGFVILDFPCNQFGGQAPGSYEDIHDFCTTTYNISFPQFAKIQVNGANAIPLYKWLKSKKPGDIPWNFTKFVINRKGEVVARFDAETSTMIAVEKAVKKEL
ncbi:MAG: glutathione peroxidase [Bacteroidales bacterium]|nr:glutathione peroxidase [Bacteroidales bacterium]